jgi:Sulfatase
MRIIKLNFIFLLVVISLSVFVLGNVPAWAKGKKPNILVIWGDDIGVTNISAYSDGIMGYQTPNIDRISNEGMRFTDYYGDQSCTAGRSTFITGQSGLRTGMTKVGLPGIQGRRKPKDNAGSISIPTKRLITRILCIGQVCIRTGITCVLNATPPIWRRTMI